jgi:outer membrane protein TolC
MKKYQRWALGLFILVLAATAGAGEDKKTVSLSLQDCIAQTLKNNVGVAIQVLGPEYAETSVALAKEAFLPTFVLGYSKSDSTYVSYSVLTSIGNTISKSSNYSFTGTQFLPGGGTFILSGSGYETNSNQLYQTINPRFGTTLAFQLTQPLLRNFGLEVSRYAILVAKNSVAVSDTQLEQSLLDTILTVETAYWNLVYNMENLKVGQQSIQLAQELLEMNKRMVEVGSLAPTEILTAEAEVATREADIIQFETQVQGASDQLKVLLNMPDDEQKATGLIVPTDSPTLEERKVDLDEALATALQYRPDLASDKLGVELRQLNVRYYRNQYLPELDFSAYYSGSAVSGTQILYNGNPVLGAPVIGTIPGNFSQAIRDTLKFKYPYWSLGLTLTIPVADFTSRASYAQAQVSLKQAVLTLKNQKLQDFLQIRNDVRSVVSNFKRINAYRVARELAEQKVTTEREKFKVGQSTDYLVLSYQRDLGTARTSEINAVVAYNVSLATLDHDLGISLKTRNVQFTDYLRD